MRFNLNKPKRWKKSDLGNQGLVNIRTSFCFIPTKLTDGTIVWFELIKIHERCILCQGTFNNFYVIWKPFLKEIIG